ncbi:MAG: hypothetical protein FJX78_07135 [Armatimonadetes bacterium]|nr:hypothetical protein [Armatimonadota bacterium]
MAGTHGHDAGHTTAANAHGANAAAGATADDPLSLAGGRWIVPVVALLAVLALLFALFRSFGDAIPGEAKHAAAAAVRSVSAPNRGEA